jgi:hypothetical protein
LQKVAVQQLKKVPPTLAKAALEKGVEKLMEARSRHARKQTGGLQQQKGGVLPFVPLLIAGATAAAKAAVAAAPAIAAGAAKTLAATAAMEAARGLHGHFRSARERRMAEDRARAIRWRREGKLR